MRALGLAAAFALAVAPSGFAADRFTSVTIGDDTANDCLTAAAPCRTLGHAIASAMSGDTVKVGAGRYQETFSLGAPIVLTLAGGYAPDFSSTTRSTSAPSSTAASSRRSSKCWRPAWRST